MALLRAALAIMTAGLTIASNRAGWRRWCQRTRQGLIATGRLSRYSLVVHTEPFQSRRPKKGDSHREAFPGRIPRNEEPWQLKCQLQASAERSHLETKSPQTRHRRRRSIEVLNIVRIVTSK